MTGWRIGMAVGNPAMINALMVVKSNLDSGIPQAIQYAAIEALEGPQDSIIEHNNIYQHRRDKVIKTLTKIGLKVSVPKASLYVWAKLPDGWKSGAFSSLLLEEKDIVVTPGAGYGRYGEGYIRLSLTIDDKQLDKGLSRLESWTIPEPS
jgi:LL-diaminopimelate aminotransferase